VAQDTIDSYKKKIQFYPVTLRQRPYRTHCIRFSIFSVNYSAFI